MAVEVQSLVTSAGGDFGRRTVNGIHPSRLQLLLGVLQKRCRIFGFAKCDVYVNIVGQMNLEKGKASDLAIAVTLASSIASIPIRADTAFVGEVGLLGELRTVPSLEKRLQEANRMGFSRVITPLTATNRKGPTTVTSTVHGMEWIQCRTLQAAIDQGLVAAIPKFGGGPKKRPTNIQRKGGGDEAEFPVPIDDDLVLDEEEEVEESGGRSPRKKGAPVFPETVEELGLDDGEGTTFQ
jgi:Subunit ChlI of Mg-chelatase